MDMIDLRLSQLAPTDLRGLPVADSKVARWLPPEFLPQQGKGILFLDEINMAPPAIQGIAQQLILDRKVGSYTVPDGWLIWAAGNRREDRASVHEMPGPLANRFLHFEVEADFESFREWALGHDIHEQVIAFLAFRTELLHRQDAQRSAWPSPRTWEMASELHIMGASVESAVGPAAAQEFDAFLKTYAKLPSLDTILAGKGTRMKFPKDPSLRYAMTIGLAMRSNDSERIANAFDWLLKNSSPEWCQLFIQATYRRAETSHQLGLMASLLTSHPEMKRFLNHLMVAA